MYHGICQAIISNSGEISQRFHINASGTTNEGSIYYNQYSTFRGLLDAHGGACDSQTLHAFEGFPSHISCGSMRSEIGILQNVISAKLTVFIDTDG